MRIVPFSIPKNLQEAFRVQVDQQPYLYNHLHQHPEIQLTLVKESSGTLVAGDYVGRFHSSDVFVIGSNQPHVFRNDEKYFKSKKLKAHTITLFFDEQTVHPTFWQLPEMKAALHFLKNSSGGYKIIGAKKKLLADKLEQLAAATGIKRLLLFLEIMEQLSQKKEVQPLATTLTQKNIKTYDGNRLNKVMAFTFKEYYRPIQLAEVAALANLTTEAFCKYFKTRTRKTYIGFLNEIRIQHACRLLAEDKSIADISYECGFTNLSNFNRVFKKIKKTAPAQWRKQQL